MRKEFAVALLACLPPTIAGVFALIVGLSNSGKLTQIHILTNSNLSKVTATLDIANEKIQGLEELIREMAKKSEAEGGKQ